jgi:hypothetical protein
MKSMRKSRFQKDAYISYFLEKRCGSKTKYPEAECFDMIC